MQDMKNEAKNTFVKQELLTLIFTLMNVHLKLWVKYWIAWIHISAVTAQVL